MVSTRTPAATGITAASTCPAIFTSAVRSSRSSATPTATITVAPTRMPVVCCPCGMKISPAARIPARIARPPSRGVGNWCRPRCARLVDRADPPGEGLHDRRGDPGHDQREPEGEEGVGEIRHVAVLPRMGVKVPATRSLRRAAPCPDTVAIVPERERQQAPDLAAVVLAALDVGVEQGANRVGPEPPLPLDCGRRKHVPRERLEVAAQPGRGGDREPLLAAVRRSRAGAASPPPCATGASSRSPRTFIDRGRASASSATAWSQNGTRASSECAMLARSVFTSRSSTR